MKEKSHALLLLSWMHDILLFEGIYVLAAAIQNRNNQEIIPFLLQGLFVLFPVALSYILIRKCRNLFFYLILSLSASWVMYIMSKSLLTGCLTAFIFLFRCYVKLKQGEIRRKMREMPNAAGAQEEQEVWKLPTLLDSPRIFHCLLFLIMYLGLIYFRGYDLLLLMLGIFAAELCVCLMYRYLERLETFIRDNFYLANFPAKSMKKIGYGILFIGVILLIIFFLPAAIYHEEPLLKLRFESQETDEAQIEYYEENTGADSMIEGMTMLTAPAKEAPEWLEKVFRIVSVIIILFISCLALKLLFTAIRTAMETFSDDDSDEIIFLGKENTDQKGENILSKRKEKESFRSPDRKIRRLYKKLIRRSLKEKPCENETPLELENKAGLYKKEALDIEKIHELYEKARYGKEACTKEEAAQYTHLL